MAMNNQVKQAGLMSGSWLAASVLLAITTPALAQQTEDADNAALQDAQPEDTAQDDANADENIIIVTAQKRAQDILEVPVAVSAFGEEALEQAQIVEFTDLTRVAPSLTITQGSNTNNSNISLRGIGTLAFSIGVEPSVSVVIDDVAVVQQAQAFSNLTDIASVEVLRGPQGTLFGKNASAGVINIRTKDPTSSFSGRVEGTMTDDEELKVVGSLSGPLTDGLGFLVNGYYIDREGYLFNKANNTRLAGEESWGVRGKLRYQGSNFDVMMIADYSERKANGTPPVFLDVPANARLFGFFPVPAFLDGVTPGVQNRTVSLSDDPLSDNRQFSGILKINVDIGEHVLTSVSSYQDWKYDFVQDVDNSNFNVLRVLSGGAANGGFIQASPFRSEQYSQELRLTSPVSDFLEYLGGLYYSHAETDRFFNRGVPGISILRAEWDATTKTESYAAFLQATLHLGSSTSLTGGARINHEKISVRFNDERPQTNLGPIEYLGNDKDTRFLGKVSLQHFMTDEIMVFASFSSGYKGQGYDVATGFDAMDAAMPVRPETSLSYEIGMKGRVWDNRLSFSLTGFWTDYDDFQAQSSRIVNNQLIAQLNNVGKLRTRGVEAEMSVRAFTGFNLNLSGAYTDAEVRSFVGADCYSGQTAAEGCVGGFQDLSGAPLSNSPEFKFSVGANYEKDIPGTPLLGFINFNYVWQDSVNFDLLQNPRTIQDSYGIANLAVGLRESENGNWEVSAFVNNLFDVQYAAAITDSSGLYGGVPVMTQIVPRNADTYAGIRMKFGF